MIDHSARPNPYVGLSPFEQHDSLFFFGRRKQTVELLELLHRTHFLAIVGSSGCGKSSLVRAGLIPALLAGFLVADRDRWRVAVMKPGHAPLRNFAAALVRQRSAPSEADVERLGQQLMIHQVNAIVDWLRPELGNDTNLLILVDQFEEIFTFRGTRSEESESSDVVERTLRRAEADDLVGLLLALIKRTDLPVYVVLTMRSDFLGDCDVFNGLPEAMNHSRYLVPRLGRPQLREAIEGPALLKQAQLTPRLLDRLLNEVGDRSDQLPVLQHALLRTWDVWSKRGGTGPVEQSDYEQAGTLAHSLERHADEAMALVDAKHAATVFQALTDTDPHGRRVRSPKTLRELSTMVGVSDFQILDLIAHFQADGRHFLTVGLEEGPERLVDISHESLIRQWPQLRTWVDQERDARDKLLELARRAVRWSKQQADLLTGVDLASAADIWKSPAQVRIWAKRYCSDADVATAFKFFWESRQKARASERKAYLVAAAMLIALGLSAFQWVENNKQKAEAAQAAQRAAESETAARESQLRVSQMEAAAAKTAKEALLAREQLKAAQDTSAENLAALQAKYDKAFGAAQAAAQKLAGVGTRPSGGALSCNCPPGDPLCSCL